MNKLLPLLIAALLTTAIAQEPPALDTIRSAIANHLDATTTPCPQALDTPASCYRYVAAIDIHKMALDVYVMSLNDVTWVTPWQETADAWLMRAFQFDDVVYLIALMPDGTGSMAILVLADDA